MTKKDYELFASLIFGDSGQVQEEATIYVVNICIEAFGRDNPLFNPDKFREACYEGKHIRKSIKG